MIQALYTGMHGMLSQQRNIDVIANNVANVGTNGYKKNRVEFRDALYLTMISPTENGPGINLQRGAGALVYQTARDFRQGARMETGRSLDFSLESPGFFAVRDQSGEIQYTRNGSFYLSVEPGGNFLVDGNGRYVLDDADRRIAVQGLASGMTAAPDGRLTFQMEDGTIMYTGVRLGVFDFDNRSGLTDVGDGNYMPSANSGPARAAGLIDVRQGGLETSNVDYGEETVRLIRAQRAYQMASRCVTVADQMAQLCNTIRT